MSDPIRVLVVGLGNMGMSHALAYEANPGYQIAGLVNKSAVALPPALQNYAVADDFYSAFDQLKPDMAAICVYSETHAEYSIYALQNGAHVFVEKPLATTVDDAMKVVQTARDCSRKLTVGYILRHHPSWIRLISHARELGGPYVFRLNLNQQSSGATWNTHKRLLNSTSPIVDCGVHYVDVMCQITDAKPIRVHGMGVRLSDELANKDMYNYGQFQVIFDDGSVGWYEAGWGPMISETAYFVKDIISPNGCVSIVAQDTGDSDDIDRHTKVGSLRIHRAACSPDGEYITADETISLPDEPDHQKLCDREQDYMLKAIREDIDLTRHWQDAVESLRICLAADESIRTGKPVDLGK